MIVDRARTLYERGATTVFACHHDPRFCYCLHVPQSFDADPSSHRLIVAVHGSVRTMSEMRDAFAPVAEQHRCVVLAPLFPVGVAGDDNGEGFKYLVEGAIRYDTVLLAMMAEAGRKLGAAFADCFLFGFSGGAQFANRFLLVHPQRLWGACIASPGSVTLPDDARDWWVGTRGMTAMFGHGLSVAALRRVPVQLVVGGDDTETWEIAYRPGHPGHMPGINEAGDTRIARARCLHDALRDHGVASRFDLVAGVGHDWRPLMPAVAAFCRDILASPEPEDRI